jgi:YVTN family beta-propeller protein
MKKLIVLIVVLFAASLAVGYYHLAGASLSPADPSAVPGNSTPKHSSSAIAVISDGTLVLAVNPDSNSLSIIDTATNSCLAEIPVGVDPRTVALSPGDDVAYVTNQGSDTLSVVDIAARAVVTDVVLGDRPVGVAVSPDGAYIAVSELGVDTVRFIDAVDLSTLSIMPVADRPYGLAFAPQGRHVFVTHLLSGGVTVLTFPSYTTYLPVIRAPASTSSPVFTLGSHSSPSSNQDQTPDATIPTWPHIAPAPAVVINAAGTRAYLPQTMANGLGLNTQFDNSVFPKVSVLNLKTWTHQSSEHISLPETDQPVGIPWDVALTQDDTELWVVNAASNDVSVIDISTASQPGRVANIPVSDNPRGIVISADGNTAYVNNTLAGTVSVIDTQAYTVTAVITVTDIPLPPILLNGKRLYHSSARSDLAQASWISCNTCHIEGEHDGRTWMLQFTGEVPIGATPVITRNTTTLLGMIETYPLRWSAEWDESADSEFSIRFEQFGTGLITGDMHPTLGDPNQGRSFDLDCLAAFIDSLQVPEREHTLTPAEQRGKALFESPQTDCLTCHPPPLYTDLQVHDVGTADAYGEWFGPMIDTPSLRFLYDSAPYLHDGNATTLYDVLTVNNPADEHGFTTHLTEQELSDLIAFLLVLP